MSEYAPFAPSGTGSSKLGSDPFGDRLRLRHAHADQGKISAAFGNALLQGGIDFNSGERAAIASISKNSDLDSAAAEWLAFARQLKTERRWTQAAAVLTTLRQSDATSPAIQKICEAEYQALQGQGALGARFEILSGQFLEQATDWKTIAPMLGVSMIGQIARAGTFSRLAATPGGMLSRGWKLRAAAGAASYLAEVPAFAALGQLAHPGSGNFSDHLKQSALTLGALKLFGVAGAEAGIGAKRLFGMSEIGFARWQPWFAQGGSFFGLLAANRLETRLGLRPGNQDGASLVADTLAGMLSLGVGSHLGNRAFGNRWLALQQELTMRSENAAKGADRHTPGWLDTSLQPVGNGLLASATPPVAPKPAGMMMAMSSETGGTGYRYHGLNTYRDLAKQSFMGDPIKNIQDRLKAGGKPVRILDAGAGDARAMRELKEYFGDRIIIHTNDRVAIQGPYIDRHFQGEFLDTEFPLGYDLVFAIFGPHAYPEGKSAEILKKSAALLAPNGEFFAALTPHQSFNANVWERFAEMPYISRALDQGILIRHEAFTDGGYLYLNRLGVSPTPELEPLLQAIPRPAPSTQAKREFQILLNRIAGIRIPHPDGVLRIDLTLSDKLANTWLELGDPRFVKHPEKWLHALYARFHDAHYRSHLRDPDAYHARRWIGGTGTSPLDRPAILLDELLHARLAELPPTASVAVDAIGEALDRHQVEQLSDLSSELDGLPVNHPERQAILRSIDRLEEMGIASEREFQSALAAIDVRIEKIWAEYERNSLAVLRQASAQLIQKLGDRELMARWSVMSPSPAASEPRRYRERVFENARLLLDVVMLRAREYWSHLSTQPFPRELPHTLVDAIDAVITRNALANGLSGEVIDAFIRETLDFYSQHPNPSRNQWMQFTPDKTAPGHTFLLGTEPSGDSYLQSIVDNLHGLKQLFGSDAGMIFYRQGILQSEIRYGNGDPSGFFLALERGHYESENGLMLSLSRGEAGSNDSVPYLARAGIHFGEPGTLRIVSLQGRPASDARPDAIDAQLKALLGGKEPLDALLAAVLQLGENAGYGRIEAIRDRAQLQRADLPNHQARPGFYDLFFRRFGFTPPRDDSDYWTLNLQTWETYRDPKSQFDMRNPFWPIDRLKLSMPLNSQDYFQQVLPRAGRIPGRNFRPKDWDLQAPSLQHGGLLAFLGRIVPAIGNLQWRPTDRIGSPLPHPARSRPFLPVETTRSTLHPFFEHALQEDSNDALRPEYREYYRRVLRAAAEHRLTMPRAISQLAQILQENWIGKLKEVGASELRYPLKVLLDEFREETGSLPPWADRIDPAILEEPVIELKVDSAAQSRLALVSPHATKQLHFAESLFQLTGDKVNLRRQLWQRSESQVVFKILPRALLDVLPELSKNGEAILTVPATQLISEDQAMEMMRQHSRTKIISPHAQDIHEQIGLDPFLAMLHDDYHILNAARFSPEDSAEIAELAAMFKHIAQTQPIMTRLTEMLLDNTIGGDVGHRSVFEFVSHQEPSEEEIEAIRTELLDRFATTPRGQKIIAAFESFFPTKTTPSGSSAPAGSAAVLAGIATLFAIVSDPAPALAATAATNSPSAVHFGGALMMSWMGFSAWAAIKYLLREKWHDLGDHWNDLLIFLKIRKPDAEYALPAATKNLAVPKYVKIQTVPAPENQLAPLAPGEPVDDFVRQEKIKLLQKLPSLKTQTERDGAAEDFIDFVLQRPLNSAQVVQAAAAIWELTWDGRISTDARRIFWKDYLHVIRNEKRFPMDSPQVYREAIRLRNVMDNPRLVTQKRAHAAEAYWDLLSRFSSASTVGRNEITAGIKSFAQLLETDAFRGQAVALATARHALKSLRRKNIDIN